MPPRTTLANPGRQHTSRARWVEDERRLRASYLATRRHLSPFLVVHRFEGNSNPEDLRRASYGYGIQLNSSYLKEILGHIRGTTVKYEWGPLATGTVDTDGTPSGGVARDLHADATKTGVTLSNFIGGEVLEWMLSSVGGFIVVDAPQGNGELTKADEQATGKRPFFRFVPWSAVEDMGRSPNGFRYVKFREWVDLRSPEGEDKGETVHHILYELDTAGSTNITRLDSDGVSVDRNGNPAPAVALGNLVSPNGEPMLPLIPVKYGTHPDLAFMGTGLLYGLDDIIIDLFNVTSEMREAYRDAAFGLLVHTGADGAEVDNQLRNGTRLVRLGDGDRAKLERLAADSNEVAAGITLIELGVKNWALGAKRQAAEAMSQSGGADSSSGTALSAEFQLDLKPLLVSVCCELDSVETNALYIAAQMAGEAPAGADKLYVKRGTEFRLEDEASRIARIAKDYILSLPLTPEMKVQLAMAWLEGADVIDLTKKVEVSDLPPADPNADPLDPNAPKPEPVTTTMTVGERIEQELRELTDAQHQGAVNMANMPPMMGGNLPPLKLHKGGKGGAPAAPPPNPDAEE